MKLTWSPKVVLLLTPIICSHAIGQQIYENGPIEVESGIVKTKYIIVGFKDQVIDTDAGVATVDTNRYPIRDLDFKSRSSPIFCVNSQEAHAAGRYEIKFGSCSPGQMSARMFLS